MQTEEKLTDEELQWLSNRIFFKPGAWKKLSVEERARISKLNFSDEVDRIFSEFMAQKHKGAKNAKSSN